MTAGLRDLKVWQEAVALAADVVQSMRSANRREIKGVVDDAMRSATAVPMRIADGAARYEAVEQQRLYSAARRELCRLETHLAVARHAGLLSLPAHQQLGVRIGQVHRLLAGYLVYLDRQVANPTAIRAPVVPTSLPQGP